MSKQRRDILTDVTSVLEDTLNDLTTIWDRIGIVPDQRIIRTNVVVNHMKNLLGEMVKEEENLMHRLIENVEKYNSELRKLTHELHLPPHELDPGLTILQREKELHTRCDNLKKERSDRIGRLKDLRSRDQKLCDTMCSTPYYIPSGSVPSKDQLKELQTHVDSLQAERDRRFSIYKSTKEDISKLLDDLEQDPNTSFERDIVFEDDETFLLTSENMKALKLYYEELIKKQNENYATTNKLRDRIDLLWKQLNFDEEERAVFNANNSGFKPKIISALREEIARLEVLKLQNMRNVINGTRKELQIWWDKCYYSDAHKRLFAPYFEDDFTEESLESHEKELEKAKGYYDLNREMFETVAKRQKLWDEFVEFEQQASDPNRLFKRGYNLFKEEAKRKKLMKELPKVEQEMLEEIGVWERDNHREFLMEGVCFKEFVKRQWEDYTAQKEAEKQQRQKARARQTEEEMLYGSRPAALTPGKRRFAGTPSSKTPTKMRKIEEDDCASTCSTANSTSSSVASSRGNGQSRVAALRRGATATSSPRAKSRYAKPKCDDTVKTPGSVSRLARTPNRTLAKTPNHTMSKTPNHSRMFSSPVCMPPRSVGRSRLTSKTPIRTTTTPGTARKALSEKNGTNETLFSHTTVSGNAPAEISLATIGPYNEFAKGLNQNARPNCRSSVMPKPSAFF